MLILGGRIYTMENAVYDPGYIKIENGKILNLGTERNAPAPEEREKVLEVKGSWVLPGLIEAHGHIGITEETRGAIADDCNETSEPVQPYLRAIDAINPMDPAFHDAIMAGITSVMTGPGSANVVGGQFVFMKTQGRCMDRMIVLEPAAMKAAFGENPKTAYESQGKCPLTRMGTAALLREELFRARQYGKQKENGKLKEEDFRLEPWLPVLRREIPLKAHAHRADDILTAIRIAKEFEIDITIDHGTEAHLIADEVAASGFPVIVGTDLTSRSKLEIQNLNFKTNRILYESGVTIAVTTDHPVALIQYLPLCAGLAVKHGLPMEEGLKALTINPARICRVEERVGSLKPGKDADIAIFSGNPMEVFTKTLYTIIDGEIVYEDGEQGKREFL
ncbi:amidohydrolase [Candidatus Merdisoma sp. JLR.KK006]|uniref:amidohydrolase n=1 Tax=Candidatus Merdisoma sp. JLR.KK006 TaxID=3112626 RepID=UPI002FF207B7